jgi:hypothetical protein
MSGRGRGNKRGWIPSSGSACGSGVQSAAGWPGAVDGALAGGGGGEAQTGAVGGTRDGPNRFSRVSFPFAKCGHLWRDLGSRNDPQEIYVELRHCSHLLTAAKASATLATQSITAKRLRSSVSVVALTGHLGGFLGGYFPLALAVFTLASKSCAGFWTGPGIFAISFNTSRASLTLLNLA